MSLPDYPSPAVIEDPYGFYAALREDAPAHRLATGEVMVTRAEDVERIARDTETFSNVIGPRNPQILGGERVGGDDAGPWPMPFADAPAHTAQRRLFRSLVAKPRLEWLAPVVERLSVELIDVFAARGEAEFRSEFAEFLPRRVMMAAFGFPAADEARIVEWSKGPGPVGSLLASDEERTAELARRRDLAAYFEAAILARHEQPGDDYLSEAVADQVARDGVLDMPYLVTEVTNVFSAGNVTTAHMMAATMQRLVDDPDELERTLSDRARIPLVLEEAMRLDAPVQWLQRIVTRDVEIAGEPVAAGTTVLINWGSACRDPARFRDPDRFDPERDNLVRRQLAFGFGAHRCLGAPLAQLEGRIAFEMLLTRLTNLRAHPDRPDRSHIAAPNQRAPLAVHIAFDPS